MVEVPELGILEKYQFDYWLRSRPVAVKVLGGLKCEFIFEEYAEDKEKEDFHEAVSNFLNLDKSELEKAQDYIYQYYKDIMKSLVPDDEWYVEIGSPEDIWQHIHLGETPMVPRRHCGDKAVYISLECSCDSEFPDDSGEPVQKLCWGIILKRLGKENEAKYKTAEMMLSNLYLIPRLAGKKISRYNNMWHSSNYEEIEYLAYLPKQVINAITEDELKWLTSCYDSFEFEGIRKRYIEIFSELREIREVEQRKKLLNEVNSLLDVLK